MKYCKYFLRFSFVFFVVHLNAHALQLQHRKLQNAELADVKLDNITIFWMHIQKTSSWMGDFLLTWACPDFVLSHSPTRSSAQSLLGNFAKKNNVTGATRSQLSSMIGCIVKINMKSGFGYHSEIDQSDKNHTVVTLFRNATDRLISAYNFGMMLPQGFVARTANGSINFDKQIIMKSSSPFITYAQLDGIAGCQTKMVLGYKCAKNVTLTAADLAEAKRRVSYDLHFFGLTEEPEATASLFLAEHSHILSAAVKVPPGAGGQWNVSSAMPDFHFSHVRASTKATHASHDQLASQMKASGWSDWFDDELYRHAAEVFYARCKQHSIDVGRQDSGRIIDDGPSFGVAVTIHSGG